MNKENIITNSSAPLSEEKYSEIKWVEENTAVLVVHGIGDQLPFETIDLFGRGLLKTYKEAFGEAIYLSHEIVRKDSNSQIPWFDNAVRIHLKGSDKFIDVYEYYWANYTEEKASWNDLNNWLQGVVDGAAKFYEKNKNLGVTYSDDSIFMGKDGHFQKWKYKLFIHLISKTFIALNFSISAILNLLTRIPVIGELASNWLKRFIEGRSHKFTNIIGDIVVYNVADPKSKFYSVRRQILDGAVHALKYLVEREEVNGDPFYSKIVVAGHSLGTQVAYDAINKMNLLVNKSQIKNYSIHGIHQKTGKHISKQLNGFITFGSPLDKIAFFLREQVPENYYLRQQLVENFHGFKQRNWSLNSQKENDFTRLPPSAERLFDEIAWRNYYDKKDYVSGTLDYYLNLKNIDCQFKASTLAFTHSNYWEHDPFYKDIVHHFLGNNHSKVQS